MNPSTIMIDEVRSSRDKIVELKKEYLETSGKIYIESFIVSDRSRALGQKLNETIEAIDHVIDGLNRFLEDNKE